MKNKEFTKIILLNILIFAAFNMVHPVTPKLINTIALPTYYFGLLYAVFNISNFIASPTFGSICDIYGKKLPMVIGLLGYTIGQILFVSSANHLVILLARIISGGFVCGYYLSSVSYTSSISTPENKLKNLAYLHATGSLGNALGSFFGGYIGVNNYKLSFLAQIIILISSLIYVLLFFKDNTEKNKNAQISFKIFSVSDFIQLSKNKIILLILILVILSFIGVQSYTSTISYYIEDILKLPTTINGVILGLPGIATIFTNLFLIPLASKRINIKTLFLILSTISGLSLIIAMSSTNVLISVASLLTFIVASTTIVPITQSMLIELASNNQGKLLGLQNGFRAIGSFFGSLIAGLIFDIWFKLPFFVSGASFLICSLLILSYKKKIKAATNL